MRLELSNDARMRCDAMRLVVNVDDVGLHPAVQRAVEACAAKGIVTSASVLANGPCVRDARSLTGIGLGAHLNLLRGEPLSPKNEIPSLVRSDGCLLGNYSRLFARYLSGGLNLNEVELEWDRQLVRLRELGLPLTHLDSEKHIHCWPRLMPIACRLAERHGLRWVRRTVEQVSPLQWHIGDCKTRLLGLWSRFHRPHFNVLWPDAVWGISDQGASLSPDCFRKYLPKIATAHTTELIVHPGSPRDTDGPLPATFGPLRVRELWEPEFRSLLDPRWRDVLRDHHIELVHYGQCRD